MSQKSGSLHLRQAALGDMDDTGPQTLRDFMDHDIGCEDGPSAFLGQLPWSMNLCLVRTPGTEETPGTHQPMSDEYFKTI